MQSRLWMEPREEQLRVADNVASRTIATILRHDARVTSYKLALIRAINDVVLSFPDTGTHDQPIAIPLRILAEYWVAYYWPFVDASVECVTSRSHDVARSDWSR